MAIFRISGSSNCFAGYPARYPVSGSCRIFRILYCFFSFVSVTFNTYHRTVADMKAAREDISFSVVAIWVFSAVRVCVFVEVQWILLVLLDSTWKWRMTPQSEVLSLSPVPSSMLISPKLTWKPCISDMNRIKDSIKQAFSSFVTID